jgi:hypothetical protein
LAHPTRASYLLRLCKPCIGLVLAAGCATPPTQVDEVARQRMFELLMPNRIEIVKPFTRIKSFDEDRTPDGIELLVRAVNAVGDSGLRIVGAVRVELFEHVPATANNRGRRLDHWEISLTTLEDQRRFWNKVTQMYEFRLGIDLKVIPRADKYVLLVTYLSPLGQQLHDEYTLVLPADARP